jgi:ADP-ribosylglycohydrolase
MRTKNFCKDILFGVAVGDALGVPVEFLSRAVIADNPVTDMRGYGTYNLPPGTFSDDSSLTFCLAEAMTEGFDLQNIGDKFVKWLHHNYWTPLGKVFDVGNATRDAINEIAQGTQAEYAGGVSVSDNGNGSLMRILPLVLYIKDKSIEERYSITKQVSSITHGHTRSVIACFYYLEFARELILGRDKFEIYDDLKFTIRDFLNSIEINKEEIDIFNRLLEDDIFKLTIDNISSSGYVVDTLEASIWCLLTTNNYKDATLMAVNLGYDTDTTSAVSGGLAALLYGFESIPKNWINAIKRKNDIDDLAERLSNKFI